MPRKTKLNKTSEETTKRKYVEENNNNNNQKQPKLIHEVAIQSQDPVNLQPSEESAKLFNEMPSDLMGQIAIKIPFGDLFSFSLVQKKWLDVLKSYNSQGHQVKRAENKSSLYELMKPLREINAKLIKLGFETEALPMLVKGFDSNVEDLQRLSIIIDKFTELLAIKENYEKSSYVKREKERQAYIKLWQEKNTELISYLVFDIELVDEAANGSDNTLESLEKYFKANPDWDMQTVFARTNPFVLYAVIFSSKESFVGAMSGLVYLSQSHSLQMLKFLKKQAGIDQKNIDCLVDSWIRTNIKDSNLWQKIDIVRQIFYSAGGNITTTELKELLQKIDPKHLNSLHEAIRLIINKGWFNTFCQANNISILDLVSFHEVILLGSTNLYTVLHKSNNLANYIYDKAKEFNLSLSEFASKHSIAIRYLYKLNDDNLERIIKNYSFSEIEQISDPGKKDKIKQKAEDDLIDKKYMNMAIDALGGSKFKKVERENFAKMLRDWDKQYPGEVSQIRYTSEIIQEIYEAKADIAQARVIFKKYMTQLELEKKPEESNFSSDLMEIENPELETNINKKQDVTSDYDRTLIALGGSVEDSIDDPDELLNEWLGMQTPSTGLLSKSISGGQTLKQQVNQTNLNADAYNDINLSQELKK